jgi:hypothetical protein
MKNKLFWVIFFALFIVFFGFFLFEPKIYYGGDLIEYFGMSESLSNHASFNLTEVDKQLLTKRFGFEYFKNPEYYPANEKGERYSTHFFFYSIFIAPVRLLMRVLKQDEMKSFRVTNVLFLFSTLYFICRFYIKKLPQRLVLLLIVLLSPIVHFIIWPGPELMYTCFILLALIFFLNDKQWLGIIFAFFASWQSQPLMFIPLSMIAAQTFTLWKEKKMNAIALLALESLFVLVFFPNLYYLMIFGKPTPFAVTNIVGASNFTLQKVIEVITDPNIGLIFYMPIMTLVGLYYLITKKESIIIKLFLFGSIVTPLFFFPAIINWNHGTAGYGPTRYALYIIPFLIYYFVRNFKVSVRHSIILVLFVGTQLFVLFFNGFFMPPLESSFKHTPYAKFILNNFPQFYNPTPEIFIERTSGKEIVIDTVIYKDNGICKKAYVLLNRSQKLINECGYIPSQYLPQLDNEYKRIMSYSRKTMAIEAVFYPANGMCAWDFVPTKEKPYTCIRTVQDFMKLMPGAEVARIEEGYGGIWKLLYGKAIQIEIPAGYIVDHYSTTGIYVNY